MRVFIVTVGRSYLTNLEKKFQEKLLEVCAKQMPERYKDYLENYMNLKAARDEDGLMEHLEKSLSNRKVVRLWRFR